MKIKDIFSSLAHFCAGTVPVEERVHPELAYHDGFWYSNQRYQKTSDANFDNNDRKVRIFLDDADLPQLDGCPFPAKIGRNDDDSRPQKYCSFLYADPRHETIEDVAGWVEARKFPEAAIFSLGEQTGQGWVPGSAVKNLICAPCEPA